MGMDPPRHRIDQRLQAQEIRRKELGQLPVLDDRLNDGMLAPELLQHGNICGIPRLGLLDDGKAQCFKKQDSELFGRIEVHVPAGLFPGLCFQCRHLGSHFFCYLFEHRFVDRNARIFHFGEISRQRQFDVPVEIGEVPLLQPLRQDGHQGLYIPGIRVSGGTTRQVIIPD